MPFEIQGIDPQDPGPAGVVARFMLAAVAGDEAGAIAMLTLNSREGAGLNVPPGEQGATFGEVTKDGDHFVVPTNSDGDEMEFLVIEEEGELRIDMDASFARMMGGMSPDDLMEEMGGAIAETMGGVMEGVADAMGAAFEGMGAAMAPGEPEEAATGRIWSLAEGPLNPDSIVHLSFVLTEEMPAGFRPPMMELESTESGDDGTKFRTTRFGDDDRGFEHVVTEYRAEGMTSDSVSMTAYGLDEGLELSLACSENVLQDGQKMTNATIRIAGPADLLESMGTVIGANFEVLSVDSY